MTLDDAYHTFFYPLHERTSKLRNLQSISDPRRAMQECLRIMRPDDLVHCMAQGADNLARELDIRSGHRTYRAIGYTLDRANAYSGNSLMPLWNELSDFMNTAKYSSMIGRGLGKLSDIIGLGLVGSVFGELLGIRFSGGFDRGDWLVEHLDRGTSSLVEATKYDFNNHVRPALMQDFG